MSKEHKLVLRILEWREKHIPEQIFILMLAFVVGVLCSFAAAILKGAIHWIAGHAASISEVDDLYIGYLITPVVGVFVTYLFVKYLVRDDISHGVTKILYALSQRKSRLKPHNMWSSMVASSITIGMGGSVGAEAPMPVASEPARSLLSGFTSGSSYASLNPL